MALRGFVLGAAFLAIGLLPAAADSVTSTVDSWDPDSRTLVLGDMSQFQGISEDIFIPEDLSHGETVTITYEGTEDGVASVLSVEIQP
ncbi:hypothetical protein [Roseibium sediminicola]|uniref:DUF1344 domain-containing protein n=1 Tax=Roseibium sediminicola TaxID=2933272 RepID=A0ABT0GTS3_9HYPH|nr:hypothetical protein [Roseibium sp. CAU 1639]MCK7612630.1 hypothetical protein [Roseibium sp. CAU 1639]